MRYASDDKSASRVLLTGSELPEGFVTILPPRFCELLLTLGKYDPPSSLKLAGEWIIARFKSGLELYSRAIANADVKAYRALFGPLADQKDLVTTPQRFD